MSGVPIAEVTANDFMQVRAALVRRVGGADAALVFSRVYYRTDKNSRAAIEFEGEMWWTASHPALARETGLTEGQARKAAQVLVDGGFVEARKLHGNVMSYRPVVIGHLLDSTDGVSAHSNRTTRSDEQVHLSVSTVAPLIDIEDVIDTPIVPKGTAVDVAFARAWAAWIPSRRGSQKKAESSFRTAARAVGAQHLEKLVETLSAHCDAWASWATSEQQYVPMMATWLNQERWTTPLPQRDRGRHTAKTDRARGVLEMAAGLERHQSQKAVAS